MPRTTKNATTKTSTTRTKRDPFAKVTDDGSVTSGAIAYGIMAADRSYMERMLTDAPILAARVHAGETQVSIATAMVEAGKSALLAWEKSPTDGRGIRPVVPSQSAANMRVSRYVRIGQALVKAGPKDDREAIVHRASKDVRKGSGTKRGSKAPKDAGTLVSALAGTVGAVVDAVTERGTVADADALLALAHDLVKRATAARDLVGKRAA